MSKNRGRRLWERSRGDSPKASIWHLEIWKQSWRGAIGWHVLEIDRERNQRNFWENFQTGKRDQGELNEKKDEFNALKE